MAESIILKGTLGLNNKIDPLRHPYNSETGIGSLAEAVNCDIDDSGMISRRLGQIELSSLPSHSVFSNGGDCFVVQDRDTDSAIMQVGTDFSLSGVSDGLTKGAKMSFCQFGDQTYYANYFESGVIENGISSPWPVLQSHVGGDTDRYFSEAPIGRHLCTFPADTMWVARDNVIWISDPGAFNKFNMAARFFQFGTDVRMIKPVAGGVWFSDNEETAFISFEGGFDGATYTTKAHNPAHEYSACIELVDLSSSALQIPGLSAIWSDDTGLRVGTADGVLLPVTETKLLYSTGSMGATVASGLNIINNVY